MEHQECKGCCAYDDCIIRNSKEPHKLFQVKFCPCRTCIVKVVCSRYNACDEYIDWLEKAEKA